jgi:hypothetical protein
MVLCPVIEGIKGKVEILKMRRLTIGSGYPFLGYYFGKAYPMSAMTDVCCELMKLNVLKLGTRTLFILINP